MNLDEHFQHYHYSSLSPKTINAYKSRIRKLALIATGCSFNPDFDAFLDSISSLELKMNHSTLKNKKQYITAAKQYNKVKYILR
jgi:hypothetical protein